jgi:uncharacterized membrane protein
MDKPDDSFRLMQNPRVRQGSTLACLATGASAVFMFVANAHGTASTWFVAGMTFAIMLCTWGMLVGIVAAARKLFASQDALAETAAYLVNSISAELHRRGDEFEAVLTPNNGIVIHKRAEAAPDPRSVH